MVKQIKILISLGVALFYFQLRVPAQHPSEQAYQLYLTRIAAAEALFQLNLVSTARGYLQACDEQWRGPEWYFLQAAFDQADTTLTRPEKFPMSAVKFNPGGNIMALCGFDSLITLYSFPGLERIRVLKGHTAPVSTIGFSKDGKKLVSGGRDHQVIVWDVASGAVVARNTSSFSQGIYHVSFNGAGTLISVASWERLKDKAPPVAGFIKLLDAHDASEVSRFETDPHPASGAAFTQNDSTLTAISWGEVIYCFDVHTGKTIWSLDLSDPDEYNAFHSFDISPDHKLIAAGSTDHRVYILNVSDGKVVRRIEPWEGHSKTIKAVSFSPDGKHLATAGEDQTIRVWSTGDFTGIGQMAGHTGTVTGLSWSNPNRLVSTSTDGQVKVWDLQHPFERKYTICDYGPWQVPLTKTGDHFAAPCSDKKLIMYETATGTVHRVFGEKAGLCGDISRDGTKLVTAGFDGVVTLWNILTGDEIRSFKGHKARVDGVAYLNRLDQMVSVGDTTVRIWSDTSEAPLHIIPLNVEPFRVIVSIDESQIIVGAGDGTVILLDATTWQETGRFKCTRGLQEMAISNDGQKLAVFSGKNIEIWNLPDRRLHLTLNGHEQTGYGIGFSGDGNYLVSGSFDQTFKFWNLSNGQCTLTWHGYQETVYSCRFIGERNLLIGGSQGAIRFYTY